MEKPQSGSTLESRGGGKQEGGEVNDEAAKHKSGDGGKRKETGKAEGADGRF